MKILLTGCAGFIGMHTSKALLEQGYEVVGIDNLNSYYDVQLKKDRLKILENFSKFRFQFLDLTDRKGIEELFEDEKFDQVLHLAAQAGVRYSLENPHAYIESNINGFMNILEACRRNPVSHLVYASSSSVYGNNPKTPFSESDPVDHPISLYAATKKSNELMAYTYHHLFKIPMTGLRFFTVYGPWGRPDMAPFLFAKAILKGEPISVFNQGELYRDFTYIDDIVKGVLKTLKRPVDEPSRGYKIYNIGNHSPVKLLDFIEILEKKIGKSAIKSFKPMQPGDVKITYADVNELTRDTGFSPSTSLDVGIENFIRWYLGYYDTGSPTKRPQETQL